MKRGWFAIAFVVFSFVVYSLCHAQEECAPDVIAHLRARTLYQASTGDVWIELSKTLQPGYGNCTPTTTIALMACSSEDPLGYLWLPFTTSTMTYTPGQYWMGLTYSIRNCFQGSKYRIDPLPSFTTVLRNWATATGSPTYTGYVGRFAGGVPHTGCPCSDQYFAAVDMVAIPEVSEYLDWWMEWETITSPPAGCNPECSGGGGGHQQCSPCDKPGMLKWAVVKELYR